MKVNIELNDEVVSKIEAAISEKLNSLVEQVISENIDDIILDTVKKQLRSVAIMYIQSPELRRKLQNKVHPVVDSMFLSEAK